jgi:hypothetical protein
MSEANPLINEKDILLDCEVAGDGVIYLTGKGKVTGDNLSQFSEWAEVVKKTIRAYDKRFATKSAIVGASTMLGLLLDALFTLTGRDNVKRFKTKREALVWLLEPMSELKTQEQEQN